jgi:dihydroorotase
MSRLIVRNGRVIDPSSGLDRVCDVAVEDGIVREVRADIADGGGSEQFDASGMVVAPGFVDIHVHLREPGFEHAETIESGSRAAAAGGFTSICCMPNTQPINDNATVTNYIRAQAERYAAVNVYPIGAITKDSAGEELSAIASMKAAGAVAISDDGRPVMNARVVRRAMEFASSLDIPLVEHCEDLHLSAGGDMHEGLESTRLGLRGIPRSSEDVMVARDLILAELTGCRYHVAHISSRLSVEMVRFAKSRGLRVTAESTPHHFAIADSDMQPYDSNYKMKPPLRETGDIDGVIEGLADGTIDAIATDHAPHPGAEKMQEFERCPFGIIGLETALGLALERLYHTGKSQHDPIGEVVYQ